MPIYRLHPRYPDFPPPEEAEPDGLIAVGGDLSAPRLLEAYRNGIFPWYEPGDTPLWWCPDPRLILAPAEIRVSRSLRATIRKGIYTVRFDTAFRRVIHSCAAIKRAHEDGTWIGSDIERAYAKLHDLGHAHSIETWAGDDLVGGLYGISLGRAFFGESMFAMQPDASKVALVALAGELARRGVDFIDCQVTTEHLMSLGAVEVPRSEFLARLRLAVAAPWTPGRWSSPEPA